MSPTRIAVARRCVNSFKGNCQQTDVALRFFGWKSFKEAFRQTITESPTTIPVNFDATRLFSNPVLYF